jgi:hypothetical protein
LAIISNAQSAIRKVDFKNFTYNVDVFETKEKLRVKNGEYFRDKGDDKLFFSVNVEGYGDLNGDGNEEAVIVTLMNTGGTGNFTNGMIYTMKDGKPVVLTQFEGGDRAYGGIASAKIEDGILIVERNDPGEDGGNCCPQFIITTRYKWNGKKLVQTGKEDKRELYPSTRISFEKGKSSAIIPVSLGNQDRKRFVIGARKGQTLTITTKTKGIAFDLWKGDGDPTEIANGVVIKLNETGDYVFDVSNTNEKDINLTMTVEIK